MTFKKLGFVLVIIFILGSLSGIFAQSDEQPPPLEDINQIHAAARQNADVNYKIRAIQQMAKLKRKESISVLIEIMNQSIDVIDPTRGPHHNWRWAAAAARAARSFARIEGAAERLTPPLSRLMRYHPEERVQGEAALSLGVVAANGDENIRLKAAQSLTEKLDKCPITKNLLALLLVKALGRLGHRRAFVSLLAVTQKGFLKIVKREAKKSLRMLRF